MQKKISLGKKVEQNIKVLAVWSNLPQENWFFFFNLNFNFDHFRQKERRE